MLTVRQAYNVLDGVHPNTPIEGEDLNAGALKNALRERIQTEESGYELITVANGRLQIVTPKRGKK